MTCFREDLMHTRRCWLRIWSSLRKRDITVLNFGLPVDQQLEMRPNVTGSKKGIRDFNIIWRNL